MNRDEIARLMAVGLMQMQIQLEITDRLRMTTYYNQGFKNHLNKVVDYLEKIVDKHHAVLLQQQDEEEIQLQSQKIARIVEKFIDVLQVKDMELIDMFLDELKAGNVAYMDGKKHKKIFNSLEKI